jgi:hypothetical protein
VTGLTNGVRYTFRVAARNANGAGPDSDTSNSVTVGLPGAPTNVVAKTGNGAATITFTPPAAAAPIVGYSIQAYEGSALAKTVSTSTGTKQVVSGLANGHTYKFWVAARISGDQGAYSAYSAPIKIGVPSAPGKPTAVAGNASMTIRWTASAANGAPVQYFVTPVIGGKAQPTVMYTVTSVNMTGLPNGKTFSFKIKAKNSRGSSSQVAAPTVVVGSPRPPTKVTASAGVKKAIVSWPASTANNGAAIAGYVIVPYRNGVARPSIIVAATAKSATVSSLATGDSYTFTVAAKNARGTGAPSPKSAPITVK